MENLNSFIDYIYNISLAEWKDFFNILFFLAIAWVSILTYRQAKKTLFAPIRLETFKLQLKSFEEIFLYFQNKSEFDHVKAFDLNRIVNLNTMQMRDSYAKAFFPESIKIDVEKRKEAFSKIVGGMASSKYMSDNTSRIKPHDTLNEMNLQTAQMPDHAEMKKDWANYEHGMIGYTQEFRDQLNELHKLAASPLLPKSIREMITEFIEIACRNLIIIGEILDGFAKEMPQQFPDPSDLKKFNVKGIWNEFNDKRITFMPKSQNILDSITSYLQIEKLMQGNRPN